MPRSYRSRGGRLTAALTRRHAEPINLDDKEREIMRLTRLIAALERKRRNYNAKSKLITKELKIQRRALKIVLAPMFQPMDIEDPTPEDTERRLEEARLLQRGD